MTHRYTQHDLHVITTRLNRELCRPTKFYRIKGTVVNVGHFFLSGNCKELLETLDNEGRGCKTVLRGKTKADLYAKIDAMIKGVENAKYYFDVTPKQLN